MTWTPRHVHHGPRIRSRRATRIIHGACRCRSRQQLSAPPSSRNTSHSIARFPGLDHAASMEPEEFAAMVAALRTSSGRLGMVSSSQLRRKTLSRTWWPPARASWLRDASPPAKQVFSAANLTTKSNGSYRHQPDATGRRRRSSREPCVRSRRVDATADYTLSQSSRGVAQTMGCCTRCCACFETYLRYDLHLIVTGATCPRNTV